MKFSREFFKIQTQVKWNIQNRATLWIGVLLLFTVGVITICFAILSHNNIVKTTHEHAVILARGKAADIKTVFDEAFGTLRSLAYTFSVIRNNKNAVNTGFDESGALKKF